MSKCLGYIDPEYARRTCQGMFGATTENNDKYAICYQEVGYATHDTIPFIDTLTNDGNSDALDGLSNPANKKSSSLRKQ